jgi:26S proteasome regulatory subunit T1
MFAIRARRKVATERDFLDAVEKVVRQGTKFSSTWVHLFNTFGRCLTRGIGRCIRCITEVEYLLSLSRLAVKYHARYTIPGNHSSAVTSTRCRSFEDSFFQSAVMRALSLARRLAHSSVNHHSRLNIEHLVEDYLSRPSQRLRLITLVSFGQPATEQSVLDSVNYVLSEIPRRLATRVRSMENLPFIVGMNPFMSRILDVHASSFHRLATYPKVITLAQNEEFTAELERLVNSHVDDIPQMAKGYDIHCANIHC